MLIKRGATSQSEVIADLIFASEPTLLSFLFGGKESCQRYLKASCAREHGQFSANYHWIHATQEGGVDGICATWLSVMPEAFQSGTLAALKDFLTTQQIIHLLAYKEVLDDCFTPPESHQLCIGHLSIRQESRRSGVASALLAHARDEAKALQFTELILDVETNNESAIACYSKSGFEVLTQSTFEATGQRFSRMFCAV